MNSLEVDLFAEAMESVRDLIDGSAHTHCVNPYDAGCCPMCTIGAVSAANYHPGSMVPRSAALEGQSPDLRQLRW